MRREQGVAALMRRRAFGLRPVPSLPSRPFGFNPSRLRACAPAALRLPPGESLAGYPRRAMLGASSMRPNRLRWIGLASAPPRWSQRWQTRWRLLRQVVRMRAVLNAGGSCPSRHEGRFTDNPPGIAMELPRHASRPAPKGAARAFSLVVGWLTWPASGGVPEMPSGGGGRAGPISFRSGSAQGVLVSL